MRRSWAHSALVLALLALASAVSAQTPRLGVRVQLAQMSSSGGLSGSAFVPVPPSATSFAAGECPTTTATGRLPRGPMRMIRVVISGPHTTRGVELGTACGQAQLSIELEDGTTLVAERGTLRLEVDRAAGRMRGALSATSTRNGEPIAIRGSIELALPAGA